MEGERACGGLEGLEAGGQIAPVVQQELLTGLEGGVELRGETGHVGGHVVEEAWGCLVVVGHLQDGKEATVREAGQGEGAGTRQAGRAASPSQHPGDREDDVVCHHDHTRYCCPVPP